MIILAICIILKLLRHTVNFMDIDKMSLNSLEKYSIFLNFIRNKAELNNNFDFLCLGNEKAIQKQGIANLGFNIYDSIFWSLVHDGVITEHLYADNANLFITLDKDKFYELCSDIDNGLSNFYQSKIETPKEDDFSIIKKLEFDSENSILSINDVQIKMSLRNNPNMAHDIIKHLLKTDLGTEVFYSELVEEILGIDSQGYKEKGDELWMKIYRGCNDIQNKVLKGTNYKIEDFLKYSTGIRGSVKIQEKYRLS